MTGMHQQKTHVVFAQYMKICLLYKNLEKKKKKANNHNEELLTIAKDLRKAFVKSRAKKKNRFYTAILAGPQTRFKNKIKFGSTKNYISVQFSY